MSTKLTSAGFYGKTFLMNKAKGGCLPFKLHKTIVGDHFGEQMPHVLTDLPETEMCQASVARVLNRNDDEHDFYH